MHHQILCAEPFPIALLLAGRENVVEAFEAKAAGLRHICERAHPPVV